MSRHLYSISDNGPQYSSETFAQYAKEWDFEHITSSPTYSKSNSLSEKTVQIIKNIFPYLAILEYRNTPLSCGKSPAQLLQSRSLRSILPANSVPQVVKTAPMREKFLKIQQKRKGYYDRTVKPLKPLEVGELIRIK